MPFTSLSTSVPWQFYSRRHIWEDDLPILPGLNPGDSYEEPRSISRPALQLECFCDSCQATISKIYDVKKAVSPFGLFAWSSHLSQSSCLLCFWVKLIQTRSSIDRQLCTKYLLQCCLPQLPDNWPRPIYFRNLTVLTPLSSQLTFAGIRTNKIRQ